MKPISIFTVIVVAVCGVLLGSGASYADDDVIYGRELMSEQERQEHRQKMRTLQGEERKKYREEHHERMQERAKEQGKSIPDEPSERGKGLRQGDGQGRGMGMGGQGSGQGRGMGGGGMGPRGR